MNLVEQLEDLRKIWEGDMPVVCDQINKNKDRLLVVLRDTIREGTYRCHRYFKVGFGDDVRWEVSVDGEGCKPETVMKWLCVPSTSTCRNAA